MSGNFTQRGEPAIYDKWTRAKWALENGCDLVIELPAVYATQSANRFAGGATNIIQGLNCVSHLSFGCETDDIASLQKVSQYKKTQEYSFRLNMALKSGNSFARAHEIAISKLGMDDSLMYDNPNCILALEYLTCLSDSHITPIAIKRTATSHNNQQLLHGITSATSIRKSISQNNINFADSVPQNTFNDLKSVSPVTLEDYFPIILSRIFHLGTDGLRNIHDVTEGLENRIYNSALVSRSMTELLESIKTKRYLYTRLQRIMLYIMLDITKDFMKALDDNNLPVYARILAINTSRSELLSNTLPDVPIIAKAADYNSLLSPLQKAVFEKDILASQMYSLFSAIRPNEDFIHPIVKKKV